MAGLSRYISLLSTLAFGVLVFAVLIFAVGCREEPALTEAPAAPPGLVLASEGRLPVVLISIDTLRSDHLGCYGYGQDVSPRIDRFRRDAVLFELAIAQAPSTLPSHASMFSSLHPAHHGAGFMERTALPDSILTLAEVLRAAGYRTASFNGGGQLASEFGLDQGFDLYEVAGADAPMSEVVDRAIRWLQAEPEAPFFLFVHSYEIHHPYTPDPRTLEQLAPDYRGTLPPAISKELLLEINDGSREIDDADLRYIVAAYDAEIHSADAGVGRLLDFLTEQGLYQDAIIILTSDHGEEFGEHGHVGWHSHTLYDELLKVPLLIKAPSSAGAGGSVAAQVRSIDIAPTVLELLQLPPRAEFDGYGLSPLLADPRFDPRLPAISQQDTAADIDHTSLRTDRFKLYPSRLFEMTRLGTEFGRLRYYWARATWAVAPDRLFDLERDPAETVDIGSSRQGEVRRRLRGLRTRLIEARSAPEGESVTPDEETLERLRALGYID